MQKLPLTIIMIGGCSWPELRPGKQAIIVKHMIIIVDDCVDNCVVTHAEVGVFVVRCPLMFWSWTIYLNCGKCFFDIALSAELAWSHRAIPIYCLLVTTKSCHSATSSYYHCTPGHLSKPGSAFKVANFCLVLWFTSGVVDHDSSRPESLQISEIYRFWSTLNLDFERYTWHPHIMPRSTHLNHMISPSTL